MKPPPAGANAFRHWVFTTAASLTLLAGEFILGDYAGSHTGRISHPFGSYPILP